MTWDQRLYFPSEGRRAEDFFALKIRRLRPGLNPRIWVPRASTLPLFVYVYTLISYSQNSEVIYMENYSQFCVVELHFKVAALHDVKEYVGMSFGLA